MYQTKERNKLKIISDPVYGFINIPSELHFDIIQHPFFQRLRRIKQLGLSSFVYPGAVHTRFDHVLGASYLMGIALKELERKGHFLTQEEKAGALSAILLHDIGHGPFSHSLEGYFFDGIKHEKITQVFMKILNREFNGQLNIGIQIFNNEYPKKYLHQLVSGQLDTDRLDYLKRDSFYTGVTEGGIGTDRLLKMLNVVDDKLVVEEKGIYTVEQFIVARRIMYWQVYLHKTVIACEVMLKKAMQRAKELYSGSNIFSTPSLAWFFENNAEPINGSGEINSEAIHHFANIDDNDIIVSLKEWTKHKDKVISVLADGLINRNLFKIEIADERFKSETIHELKRKTKIKYSVNNEALDYLVISEKIINKAYSTGNDLSIGILSKKGIVSEITKVSDVENIAALSKQVEKYFICYPKDL
jgi:HD superfamily phosphohydrolase